MDKPPPGLPSHHLAASWFVRPPAPPEAVSRLARELELPPILASVLWSRGLRGDALQHLHPSLTLTSIPNLGEAAERLETALRAGKRILIHGDYDADGISGTALLTLGLRALGGEVTPFIPNRLTDGYGIHPQRVAEHAETADLFITVDCGISNLEEIRELKRAGVEVIISDHHHPGPQLPDCLIVHPKLSPLAQKGLPGLTGAGVAFHLLWALHRRLGIDPPLEYADMATIGTIADVAPLLGENRALIQEGLRRLPETRWPGLRATLIRTGLDRQPTARDVAFIVAPRLNAAGRLGEAQLGLELLITSSKRRALELAAYLDARNADRKRIQDAMVKEALAKADPDAPAIVLHDDNWHPGVMGIVASQLLERFYRPVFIIADGKGSVRSTPGISAVGGLHAAAGLLTRFGGHAQAAGFAIESADILAFRQAIYRYVQKHPKPRPTVIADALLSADEVDYELFNALQKLEPYGEGHPAPLFALTGTIGVARAVGRDNNTLQLQVAGLRGVAWRKGELAGVLRPGTLVNTAISLRENVWRNRRSLEFIAEDVRQAESLPIVGENGVAADNIPDLARIHRGPPAAGMGLRADHLPATESEPCWLRNLPLHEKPLELTSPLQQLLALGGEVFFDLDDRALNRLEQRALHYPEVADLRTAYLCMSRGQPSPFDGDKRSLIRMTLGELDLVDEYGRIRRGKKRNPYSSETFLAGSMERYKLRTFLACYRALDDHGFARAVLSLFSLPSSIS